VQTKERRSAVGSLITSEQTIAAGRASGLKEEDLQLSGIAVLTFSRSLVERLEETCGLVDVEWLGPRIHPYSGPHVVKRGTHEGLDVLALVPAMGASPLACTIEDLIACGIDALFLACGAWSLGPPVAFGDVLVPSYAVGPDGTSIHYGNTEGRIDAEPAVVAALRDAARDRDVTTHVGGNASCEALYRITPEMVESFRNRDCVSMENGEAAVLFAVCRSFGIPGGAIFQPYIDLTEGWNPDRLDDVYQATCRFQAEIVLDAAHRLRRDGVI
jgi:uridine phosphorylase